MAAVAASEQLNPQYWIESGKDPVAITLAYEMFLLGTRSKTLCIFGAGGGMELRQTNGMSFLA